MKQRWIITTLQNGGEYFGYTTITCQILRQCDSTTVSADGVVISFDEAIHQIESAPIIR